MNWIVFAGLSACSAGLIPILAKRDPSHLDPTVASTLRAFVMTGCLVMAAGMLGQFRRLPTLDRPAMFHLFLTGLACAASWVFYFLALKTGPAAKVVAVDRASAAVTLVLGAMFLGEALTWKSALGIGMILAGMAVTVRS